MAKKYYWLKLKTDFFNSKEMKKLRRMAGGDTFVIIYLKMQLLSLKNEGKIYFDGVEEDFASEIALMLDEDPDNVRMTMAFLQNYRLIEFNKADECFLTEVPEVTGKECDSAERVRKYRANLALQCNTDVTKCNTEKEIELEKDKELEKEKRNMSDKPPRPPKSSKKIFGEYKHVKLTDEEYNRLCNDYSENIISEYIRKIDEYLQMTGKKPYKDYNLTIRKWLDKNNIRKGNEKNAEFIYKSSCPDDEPF